MAGQTVTLTGSSNYNGVSYEWVQQEDDVMVDLQDASTSAPTFIAPSAAPNPGSTGDVILTFILTVTSGSSSVQDSVRVTVKNTTPDVTWEGPPGEIWKYVGILPIKEFQAKYDLTAIDADSLDLLTLSMSTLPLPSNAALAVCESLLDADEVAEIYRTPGTIIAADVLPDSTSSVCIVGLGETDNGKFSVQITDGKAVSEPVTIPFTMSNPVDATLTVGQFIGLYPSPPTAVISSVAFYWDYLLTSYFTIWKCNINHYGCEEPSVIYMGSTTNSQSSSDIRDTHTITPNPEPLTPGWSFVANVTDTTTTTGPGIQVILNSTGPTTNQRSTGSDTDGAEPSAIMTMHDTDVEEGDTYTYMMRVFAGGRGSEFIPLGTITIPDTTAPELSLFGQSMLVVPTGSSWLDPGYNATDNVDGDLTANVTVTGMVDASTEGTYRLYYDVADSSSNPAIQQNRTVNVVEYYPYVSLSGGPYQTILQGSGPYADPGAICVDDTDADRPVNSTGGTVDTNTAGVYHLTYACTDSDGNDSYVATRAVTVEDAPPVITPNGPAELAVPLNSTYTDPGATCIDLTDGALQATAGGDTVDSSTKGSYRTTYSCTDSHGHTATTTRTVTVAARAIPPSITLIGPSPDTVGQQLTYDDPGALCADDIDPVRTIYAGSYPDTDFPGNYTLTYACTDSGGSAAVPANRTLVVEDNPPDIYVWGQNPLTLGMGANFTDPGAGCGDFTDGILNANVTVTGEVDTSVAGAYAISYACTDSHGHRTEAARTVLVGQISTGPVPYIVLNGPASATVEQGLPYLDPGAFCADDIDPVRTIYAARADTSATGSQTLTYTCTDSDGNAAVPANRTLVVEDSPPYIDMWGPNHMVLSVGADFTDYGAQCNDRTDGISRATAGGDAVDTSMVGAYTITYACTDSGGLRAVPITRTVLVTSPPGSVPALALNGSFAETIPQGAAFDDPGAFCTDDIDPVRTIYAAQPDTSASGSQTLTYTCTDSNGNAAIPAIRILVVLDAPPVITLNGNVTITLASGGAFSDPGAACADLTDGPLPVVTGGDTVDTAMAGAYTISYTCVDGHGQRAETSRTVSVTATGNSPPVLGQIGNMAVNELAELAFSASASDPDGDPLAFSLGGNPPEGASINATTGLLTWTPSEGQGPAVHTLNVTVRDGDGATHSLTFNVTVAEVNAPPVMAEIHGQETAELAPMTVQVSATDPDLPPNHLTFNLTGSTPEGVSIDPSSGTISWTPTPGQAGLYDFNVTVVDGAGGEASRQFTVAVSSASAEYFVTTWKTTQPNESITIPTGGISGTYTVDWGDGTAPTTAPGDQAHTYGTPGNHTVRISGDFTRMHLGGDPANAAKLVSIDQWGSIQWTTMREAFAWASNMAYRATDTPDLSRVADTSLMFTGAYRFDGDLSSWDVSGVANTAFMFFDAFSFNGDLSSWDVSSATNMTDMFNGALSFQRNLGGWYIVPDGTTIISDDAPGIVAGISAQNTFLDRQNPTYGIGTGGDSASFSMNGTDLVLDIVPDEPTYAVNITSTGDFGTDNHILLEISVTGLSPNRPPVADAGPDQAVQSGWTVTLDGTGSSDRDDDTLSYMWSQTSGTAVALSDSSAASPTFTAPNGNATLAFRLNVTDGLLSSTDTVSVSVTAPANRPPAVGAGPDQAVDEGSTVRLNGTATDPDGDPLTYLWTHDSDLAISLANATAPSTQFTAPQVGSDTTITFTLTVTDSRNATASDSVILTIADVSEPHLGPREIGDVSLNSTEPGTVVASWSAPAEAPADYRVSWAKVGETFLVWSDLAGNAYPTAPSHTVTDLEEGEEYKVRVRARYADDTSGPWSAEFAVIVAATVPQPNNQPVADAGDHQSVQSGLTVTLDGTGSSDPDSGDSISYSWSQTSGTTVTLSNSSAASPTFTAPAGPAVLVFELRVADRGGLTSADTVNVTVAAPPNRMPVADAGPDQAVASGAAVTLDGTGSSDPDSGDILSYDWSQTSGTAVALSNSTVPSPTFTAPAGPAVLVFELSVTDTGSLSSADTVNVTVAAPPNRMPVADAGEDQTVASGAAVTLDGTGSSDPDGGDVLSYMWRQTSGDTVTLSDPAAPSPTFAAPVGPALLAFLLNVTDGSLFSTDAVSVNVTAPPNVPPVLGQIGNWTVNEGSELSIMVSAADGNPGDAVTYSVSGAPPGAAFDPATGKFSWTPAESQGPGSYVVTFGATDGLDAAEPRTATITVNEVNQAPLFERSAREGYSCNAAVNGTVTLDFAVTDPDLPAQTLVVDDASSGDIAYSAAVVDGTLKFSAAIVETDGQQFPYDHRLLFYIVVADGHDPPGTDNVAIRVYLPEAGEPDWPPC